jgi:hypothetical protein
MEDSSLAGVREAMSTTWRIISESPALLASALNAVAADSDRARETDDTVAPNWPAISVIVDGVKIDDRRADRKSATSASAPVRVQWPYQGVLLAGPNAAGALRPDVVIER